MVAASLASGMRVEVSRDGTLACLVGPRSAILVRLPLLERDAEVVIEEGSEVALVGDPALLVVVTRGGVLHVVNPRAKAGPEKLAELAIDPGSRILATTDTHLLLTTHAGPVLVLPSGTQPTMHRLPLRGVIDAAGGSASPHRFVVSVGGALEEWSSEVRAPLRRFRLERPIAARHVGGNSRHIWLVPDAAPSDLVIVPLASSRPVRIELPEPALRVAADPFANQLAIVGEDSGKVYLVQLADRSVRAIHPGPIDDVVWAGSYAILCARDAVLELLEIPTPGAPEIGSAPSRVEAVPTEAEPTLPAQASPADRLSAWKERVRTRNDAPSADATAIESAPVTVTTADPVLAPVTALHEWRDAVAIWARRLLTGGRGEPPLLAAGPLHDVAQRLGLTGDEATVLWLVYGARLCGYDGVAPIDIAAIAPLRWLDALGRSRLGSIGAFRWRRNRVDLTRAVAAALDERAPLDGLVMPSPVVVERTVAVVAAPDVDLELLGAWAAPKVGALIVPTARGLRMPARFLFEARVRGLSPLIRAGSLAGEPPPERAIVVVDAEDSARSLGLGVAMTWRG